MLAAQAPDLHEVLGRAHREGCWSHVTLDGTLIETDLIRAVTSIRCRGLRRELYRWSPRQP